MSMVIHQPSSDLLPFIEFLWYVNLKVPYQLERILPTGRLELIINFGDSFRLYDRANPERFTLQTESWLVGLQSEYLLNEPLGQTHMMGVRFRPGGFYAFHKLPAHELHNQIVPLESLWGSFATQVRECLLAERSLEARFALLERLLRSRLGAQGQGLAIVQAIVKALAEQNGAVPIHTLSEDFRVSHKHLISQFKLMVGVTPKALAKIYRLQHVLHDINLGGPMNWAGVAYAADYYDQAHFNHEFAAFTGLNPGDYLRMRRQIFGNTLGQAEDVHFVPLG